MAKQEKIKISVVIKTKNSQNFLYEVLESVKNTAEIIAIDNHSTDDTVEILKEYKAKIIYSDSSDFSFTQKQLTDEISSDWVLIIKDSEIVPLGLLKKIENFILNPPKNCVLGAIPIKTYYSRKEIKSLYIARALRLFKKGYADFENDFSLLIKPRRPFKKEKIKVFNFKKSSKKEENILNFVDNDIAKNIDKIVQTNKNKLKFYKSKKSSVIIRPINTFIKYFIFKKGFLDGKYGFIFARMKFIEEFIFNVMILEKNFKGEKYDI